MFEFLKVCENGKFILLMLIHTQKSRTQNSSGQLQQVQREAAVRGWQESENRSRCHSLFATNVPDEEQDPEEGRRPIPWRIAGIHILFLCWTVANAHYPVLVILGLLFFLAFVSATRLNQHAIALRPPLLLGFFLPALIIHGGCQQWWIGACSRQLE